MDKFQATRISRSYTQRIIALPEVVFPLLCPVQEKDWLEGWDSDLIYSESGLAEENCVFVSRQNGEVDTLWIVTHYDAVGHRIEFVRVTPGSRIARLHIALNPTDNDQTQAKITYTYTALTECGNQFIADFTQEKFEQSMRWWEKSMNHYLETGTQLKIHG